MKISLIIYCVYIGLLNEFVTALRAVSNRNVCTSVTLQNGSVKRRTAKARVIRYFCNRGFLLAGTRHSTCFRNKWDPPPPKCVRPTCKAIGKQPNGDQLLIYPTHSGAVQHFFCKAGFILNGPRDVYCDGTKWTEHVPICLPVNTKPKLSCDFEETDLCGWTHDLNHDFDWTRENYQTPSGSIGTGPSFDHTKGPGEDGYYMYIESSSRAENDTARLISPVYEKSDGKEICFEFFYHMFGSTIGTLRVYLKTVKEPWTFNPEKAFFSKSGNQADKWYRSLHHLGIINDEFQIIIEGVRGSGYVSDIAIDDVKLIYNCGDEPETTTTMESSTYNELIPTVESCDNRCGQSDSHNNTNYVLTCDCDNDCFDNNRCCPDYFDLCAGTTLSEEGDTEETTTTKPYQKYVTTEQTLNVTLRVNPITNPTTTPKIIINSTKPYKTTTTTKKLPVFTPLKPTTPKVIQQKTSTTKTQIKVTTKATPKFTRPVIRLQTPPVTPYIFRKIITTTTPKPKPTQFVLVYKTTKTDKQNTIDDAVDVPRPTDSDEGNYDIINVDKEFWPDEIDNNIDSPVFKNFNESNKLFSQSYIENANSHFLILGISIAAMAILISIVVVIALRRYKFTRGFLSSNGESQSDVRFLKDSDSLDFSLPDCYSE